MALRQVILGRRIEERRTEMAALETAAEALRERRTAMNTREEQLTAALNEVNDQTPEEDRATLEGELDTFEADARALEGEEQENENQRNALQTQIDSLQAELDELNRRAATQPAPTPAAPIETREDVEIRMTRNVFSNMPVETRTALFAREDVRGFVARAREAASQRRSISGGDLLIPEIMLPVLRTVVEESSKLLKHVNLQHVRGTSRQTIVGVIPEAVWTEMCAKLNELQLGFNATEMDGYKVGGFIPVCNALLADASDVDLANEIIITLGRAIGLALDKAILYGTGTKMPLGIVTRLAQTEQPAGYSTKDRPWVDLHTTNIKSITAANSTGIKLFQSTVDVTGALQNDYAVGDLFWAMNKKTYNKFVAEAMSVNAAGAVVSGMSKTMPVLGGAVETLNFIPDNVVITGYGELYALAERAGTAITQSEHVRFIDDQTVFKGTARYDGKPVIAEGFVAFAISGGTVSAAAVTFAADTANA